MQWQPNQTTKLVKLKIKDSKKHRFKTYQHNVNTQTSTISILITFFLDFVKFKSRLAFALPGWVACFTMQAIQVYVYPKKFDNVCLLFSFGIFYAFYSKTLILI